MFGKPYHKMPVSSWMIPGGNRDQKRSLMKAQKYPMVSAIKQNLGGPLSEVFFSFLTHQQQDFIGYTPKLKGPGEETWVSPSDILQNHVVLTPPYTNRLKQAMTHQGIMKLGQEVEAKLIKKYEDEIREEYIEKEKVLREEFKSKLQEAIIRDREYQEQSKMNTIQKATTDLTKTFQEVLSNTVEELLKESCRKLQKEVNRKQQEMEDELCQAVNQRSDYLSRQYEFQLAWRENELLMKCEDQFKKLKQISAQRLENVYAGCLKMIKAKEAEMEANHVTDLIIRAAEQALKHHEEKNELENNFENWFMKYFDDEIITREFSALNMENEIRLLKKKCERREYQMREVFRHFQKFINFALKEKPGQAEFLLSLEKELQEYSEAKSGDKEVELMARMIIEFIIKTITDKREQEKVFEVIKKESIRMTIDDFRDKIHEKRTAQRALKLEGEKNFTTLSEKLFKQLEQKSLAKMFEKSPSMVPLISSKKPKN
ncbi:uncharacterized protein LOC124365203 [Homalodisca vitripennis]|uniref:uncharacterized protein LOC124365203 n=1 Tax=Homalodisca vitripennis TaxID=197043 RepID=UPI001EEB6A34|nr:uncharacterized protein LOC124365203 [Homalodisca vitripennis]KAG8293650.1 hypothetical protein J6590_013799 [Homalodisca vitripennis]